VTEYRFPSFKSQISCLQASYLSSVATRISQRGRGINGARNKGAWQRIP